MKRLELEAVLGSGKWTGNEAVEITGVQYDSRKVQAGDCFVCIRGFQTDGRAYALSAVESGATLLVYDEVDHRIEEAVQAGAVGVLVSDARKALAEISAAFYQHPSKDLVMVGVTGTNGKTSITHLVSDLMEQMGKTTAVFGTIANRIGDVELSASVTTPESLELNQMLNMAREAEIHCCAMEVSSHAMSLKRVHGIQFDYGIFTNLTKDHLDFHGTMEAYFEAKASFFNMPQKGIILNGDDPHGQIIGNVDRGTVPVVLYGTGERCNLKAFDIELSGVGSHFQVDWKGQVYSVSTPLPGLIYVYNTLAAAAVMLLEGFDPQMVFAGLNRVKPLRGRLEPVPNQLGITVLVDYAHTPDGLENAIRSARIFTKKRLITVFGCGGNRDRTKRPQMGRIAAEKSDYAFVTSDNPRKEKPEEIIDEILTGMEDFQGRYETEVDRRTAIRKALQMAKPGDTVLIAGKGHETYQIIGETRIHFDDREEVLNWLMEENQ